MKVFCPGAWGKNQRIGGKNSCGLTVEATPKPNEPTIFQLEKHEGCTRRWISDYDIVQAPEFMSDTEQQIDIINKTGA